MSEHLGKREREARKRKRRTIIEFRLFGWTEGKRLKLGRRKLAEWERWRQHQGGGSTVYGARGRA